MDGAPAGDMDADGNMRMMRVTWMLCAGIEDVKAVATLAMLVLAAYGEELLGRQSESEVRWRWGRWCPGTVGLSEAGELKLLALC